MPPQLRRQRVRRHANGTLVGAFDWGALPDELKAVVFDWLVKTATDKVEAAATLYAVSRSHGMRWGAVVQLHSGRRYWAVLGAIRCIIGTNARWAAERNARLRDENSRRRQNLCIETGSAFHLPFHAFNNVRDPDWKAHPTFLSPHYLAEVMLRTCKDFASDVECYAYYGALIRAYKTALWICEVLDQPISEAQTRLEGRVLQILWRLDRLPPDPEFPRPLERLEQWAATKNRMHQAYLTGGPVIGAFGGPYCWIRMENFVSIHTDLRRFVETGAVVDMALGFGP